MEEEVCPHCNDSGLKTFYREDGERFVRDCSCRIERRARRMIARSHIPRRFENCLLENYDTDFPGATASLRKALRTAKKFVESFPLDTNGNGLLLSGPRGVGKTHMAISILKALVAERGATGLFVDYGDLLKQVQNSYNRQVQATELEILAPVFDSEVLVLDELGSQRPSDWVWDTVSHILNTRYNNKLTTIITTNYPNFPETEKEALRALNEAEKAMYKETLGDRIGGRMQSRLQEMCVVVEMQGEDFRATKLADFG